MSLQPQASWLIRSWVLAVVLVFGAALIVWDAVDHAWLGLAGTTLGLLAFFGTREAVRRHAKQRARG